MRKLRSLSLLSALFFLASWTFLAAQEAKEILVLEISGQANGTVEIELFADIAPRHVTRIKRLAREGYYDNVAFHRVIDGFMAQTGDVKFGNIKDYIPRYAGLGGSIYEDLDAEFSDIAFERGTLGMARASDVNSANSQFFIMFDDAPHLNGQYTVFGRIISGMEVIDAIKRGYANANGLVDEPDIMARAYISQ